MAKVKGGLGKGLEALFVDNTTDSNDAAPTKMALGEIEPNREQPRKQFEGGALADLADSIRQHGVLQPLLVRPMADGTYQLVAGERRWRAARMAGLSEVPVIIRELTDSETIVLALIENLQREDLNVIEEALGYRELMEQFGMTQEQASAKVGKSRPVIANALRLLNLPQRVLDLLEDQQLSAGHARCLLALEDEQQIIALAEETIKKGYSVRQLEAIVKRVKKNAAPRTAASQVWDNSFFTEVELALTESLSRKVKVNGTGEKGQLTIEFYGEDDLRTLTELFSRMEALEDE